MAYLEPGVGCSLGALKDGIWCLEQALKPEQAHKGLVQRRPHRVEEGPQAVSKVPQRVRHAMEAAVPPHRRTCRACLVILSSWGHTSALQSFGEKGVSDQESAI